MTKNGDGGTGGGGGGSGGCGGEGGYGGGASTALYLHQNNGGKIELCNLVTGSGGAGMRNPC